MRLLIGAGTPKEVAVRGRAFLLVGDHALAIFFFAPEKPAAASSPSSWPPSQHDHNSHIFNGLVRVGIGVPV